MLSYYCTVYISSWSFVRDRKRKRFVREGGKEGTKKKVKTESGAWVSSSYKSGIYKNWKESNRLDGMLAGEENEDTVTSEYIITTCTTVYLT